MNEKRLMRAIEIASVLIVVGAAVALSVPKRAEMARSATAAQLLEDVEVVRQAIYRFYSDSAYFPAQRPGERIPPGLSPYLPPGFSLRKPYGTFDYRNWPVSVKDSMAKAPNVVGVTVTVFDPRIGAAAGRRAHDVPKFTIGNKYTFLFFGV